MKSAIFALGLLAAALAPAHAEDKTGYAPVNGLQMYYEIHGEGAPIVLLHGAYMSIPSNWQAMIPVLAEDHQVIAVELQAHGRTNDRDTPISYRSMADDVAALLDYLEIDKASMFGYSMGAAVAIDMAVRHPDKVERLIAASGAISYDGLPEGFKEMMETITPELFAGSPMEAEYLALSPDKDGFPNLVEKLKSLDLDALPWTDEQIGAIDVPTLLIFGDADIVTSEHQAHMYRVWGGNTNADTNGFTSVQMLVLPGTSHIGVFYNPLNVEILKLVVPHFLTAQIPAPAPMM